MPIVPKNYSPLSGSERKPRPGARFLGPAKDADSLTVTVVVRRRPDGPPIPDYSYFLNTPPSQRRRLSKQDFSQKYGAAQADIDRVGDFVRAQNLTIVETNIARRTIIISGTVSQFNKAFHVELGRYEHEVARDGGQRRQTETYRGRDGFIFIPKDLDGIIVGVFGLDNRRITKRAAADPPGTATISVPDVMQRYNFPANFAAGQTIGIFSEAGYQLADLHQYNTTLPAGFSVPDPTDITVRGSGNDGSADAETTQDISIAATAARGASMAVYFTTYDQVGWVDLLLRVVHPDAGDPVCSVLSSSFYVSNGDDAAELANEGISISWLNAVSAGLQDAAIQGVTFCTVSGDYGVDTSSYGGAISDGKQHVVYPGSDPWALCCGGTTIGPMVGGSWDEYVWNDMAFGQQWATGGGVSDFFNFLPSYQIDAGIPPSIKDGHVGRGVPDVAANASVNSGYPIIIGGAPGVGDGTSAAAPLWAGLIAVINAALGESIGFVNPVLYALGSSVFRDIVAPPGPTTNGINGVPGYPAGPGWDACTGWGSPNGISLLHGLKHFYGPAIAVNLQDDLRFGIVCKGPKFLTLRVFNVGTRDLMILSVKRLSGSGDFSVLSAPTAPLAIEPGDLIDFTIEYNPTMRGVGESATFRITSNDPVTPLLDLTAKGFGGTGALETIIADHGDFGKACVGSFVDKELTLNNNGPCTLSIYNVQSTSAEFITPSVSKYPLIVASGVSIGLPIRFQPSGFGNKSATLSISSDDPSGVRTVHVSGRAPYGKLVVTGSAYFGEVDCGVAQRSISICNIGECDLRVFSVEFRRERRHFKLIGNPFPATLPRGCCLQVVIQYKASCDPECCELVITSDDPNDPVKTLDVVAYTRCVKPCPKCCEPKCECEDKKEDCC